jgi:hypothetical protein
VPPLDTSEENVEESQYMQFDQPLKSTFRIAFLLIFVGLSASACSDLEQPDDAPHGDYRSGLLHYTGSQVCGMQVLPSPAQLAVDPCEEGALALAESFEQQSDSSSEYSTTLQIDDASRLCASVDGADGAELFIDGEPVSETFELAAGTYDLTVEMDSSTVGSVALEVRADEIRPGQTTVHGTNGRLEVSNVAVDHPLFSPNGDGFHDTTTFNADNVASDLPGQGSGQFDYFLNWEWTVTAADSCTPLGVLKSGVTQVDSLTKVQSLWDGSASPASNTPVADGRYIYQYTVDLVRSDGLWIDTAVSNPHGVLVDSTSTREPSQFSHASTGALTNANRIFSCDPNTDSTQCQCPQNLPSGMRCTFAQTDQLETFDDPANLDTSPFMDTTYDSNTDRWHVRVDFRNYNGGGLVPQSDGQWKSLQALQAYIEDLTGVPADSNMERLFNFDYTQLGYSTPIYNDQPITGFDHFLLDVITDEQGILTIGQQTFDLPDLFDNGDPNIPSDYQIQNPRTGDWCTHNGNTNGSDEISAYTCTKLRNANIDPTDTDIGIYRIKTRFFELVVNNRTTTREYDCSPSGYCNVRSMQVDGTVVKNGRELFTEVSGQAQQIDFIETQDTDTPSLIKEVDRHRLNRGQLETIDGACSEGVIYAAGMDIPLDSADGSVDGTCIINGIWF